MFRQVSENVREVAEIVEMVDERTDGIVNSTNLIQSSVDRVKEGLTAFAGDIRVNGRDLVKAEDRLHGLEQLSNRMLDTLANSGADIDDTPFILTAQEATRLIVQAIERGLDGELVSMADVFDRDYRLIPGTNPPQHDSRFCDFADAYVRPILDRFKASDARIIGSAITDVNGYLPTHLTERSLPPSADPVWNDANCRNKRIFMDDTTRNAVASERPAMLGTYRMELGDRFVPVKNVFVPLWVKGRRWGNFELAYRDD
jgi:methyl-accepting chemotaxis protein